MAGVMLDRARVCQLKNYEFRYLISGSQKLPAILFLHGFMGDINEFDAIISLLSDRFCCLAVDLPGHGKTKITGGNEYYTMPNTARSLIEFLAQLNIKKCFAIGYSMGGRLALYLTLNFPEYFSKVMLESASPGLKTRGERLKRIQSDRQLALELETGDFLAFLTKWYSNPIFASLKKHPDFEAIIRRRLDNNPFELAKSLHYFGTGYQPSLWENLTENKIPLLLLVGEYDEKFIIINTEIASLCKSARIEVISNSGHNIHLENADAFVKCIRKFFTVP